MTKPEQYTRADLKTMSPQQIEAARVAGRLRTVLGQSTDLPTLADIAKWRPEDIAAAEKAGRLDHLFTPDDAA